MLMSSMKLRMKKMPRPLALRMFSGVSGSARQSTSNPFPLVEDPHDQLDGRSERLEREFDGDQLAFVLAIAMLDSVDRRLADGDPNPVSGLSIESAQSSHLISDELDKIQHVEATPNF